MSNVAIRVSSVDKSFVLPHEKVSTVKGLFTSLFRRRRGGAEVQHALREVSFEVKKGEFFGIVGRNGSGKSTLLKILAGIYQPSNGHISTHGKLVPFIELGVGFNPELTGRENVYLNGAMLGFSTQEIDAMYDDIVAFAELERFMDQKLKNYSSGMQVRLAFSMATRSDADILLIDEVLAVGDADFQRKCFDYFKMLKKKKKTVIFVSHDMEAVREYCSRAVLVDNGSIVQEGSANKIAEAYIKLFNSDATAEEQEDGETANRWGDGSLKFKEITVHVTSEQVVITCDVEVKEKVDEPIFGIRIRDAAGNNITGTNTKIEHNTIADSQPGDRLRLTWVIANIFADGKYVLDPAIVHNDGITVADWWNEARRFSIDKNRHLPYPVDPGFQINISRK